MRIIQGLLSPSEISEDYYAGGFYPNRYCLAWYHFNEGIGSTTEDSFIYNYDGSIFGAKWIYGLYPSSTGWWSLYFDGYGDYVNCGTDPVDRNGSVTFEAWVYPESGGNVYQYVLSSGGQGSASQVGYYITCKQVGYRINISL